MLKYIFVILFMFISMPVFAHEYKVLRVVDGDTVYVDFNENGYADLTERVRINGIDAFEVHPSANLRRQMSDFNLSELEILTLGYLGKEFAKQALLYKYVRVDYSAEKFYDKYNRPLVSIIYDKNKSYEKEILNAGLATVYPYSNRAGQLLKYENRTKIKKNAAMSGKYNLMYFNYKTKSYYPINSEEALKPDNILINFEP